MRCRFGEKAGRRRLFFCCSFFPFLPPHCWLRPNLASHFIHPHYQEVGRRRNSLGFFIIFRGASAAPVTRHKEKRELFIESPPSANFSALKRSGRGDTLYCSVNRARNFSRWMSMREVAGSCKKMALCSFPRRPFFAPFVRRSEHTTALNILDSLLRGYDRRATPTNHLGEWKKINLFSFHNRK